jgi:GGDEF domain-containing protein
MVAGLEDQPLQLDRTMTGLLEVMRSNLRRGDTVTRQNVNQIAMLLPMASEMQGQMIMERIKRGFYQQFPNSDCRLTCRFALLSTERRNGAKPAKTE